MMDAAMQVDVLLGCSEHLFMRLHRMILLSRTYNKKVLVEFLCLVLFLIKEAASYSLETFFLHTDRSSGSGQKDCFTQSRLHHFHATEQMFLIYFFQLSLMFMLTYV